MPKLVWMSDLHFVAEGDVQRHDPRVRLDAAIAHVNEHHSDAALCIVSGDIVNHGRATDYAAVAERLRALRIPCHPMVGNHDNRALLRAHLPVPDGGMEGFVQFELDLGKAVLLCLDTLDAGSDGGAFCDVRQAWLAERLRRHADRPVLAFAHHPPMPLGLPTQDGARVREGAALLDLLVAHGGVRHLCLGHVHRPMTGCVHGIPFTTMRAVLYQAPPPRPVWDWSSFQPAEEAPALGVVMVEGDDVTIQFDQFCRYEIGVAG